MTMSEYDEGARDAQAEIDRYRQALADIVTDDSGGRGCSTYSGSIPCRDPRSGRTKLSGEGATSWCVSCIATDALVNGRA